MATKAVNLELVSGYDSQSFIAAFRRFTSIRGSCTVLVSDRGTTIVSVNKILKGMYIKSSSYMQKLVTFLADEGTTWKFNPPGAPHFGGIWEAAVKSVKHHIYRVLGYKKLTLEEFYTFLKQIESCLNSRPLLPLTQDFSDELLLSPSLLLNQSQSYLLPEPNYIDQKILLTQRYKSIQQMVQNWWKLWSRDYLKTLQARNKWKLEKRNIIVNDIVLISDETIPPARWPLARVIKLYKGTDSFARVTDLKTSSTVISRPIHKLILLFQ